MLLHNKTSLSSLQCDTIWITTYLCVTIQTFTKYNQNKRSHLKMSWNIPIYTNKNLTSSLDTNTSHGVSLIPTKLQTTCDLSFNISSENTENGSCMNHFNDLVIILVKAVLIEYLNTAISNKQHQKSSCAVKATFKLLQACF